jgi:ParB/RepB/Spo0J family partition protein
LVRLLAMPADGKRKKSRRLQDSLAFACRCFNRQAFLFQVIRVARLNRRQAVITKTKELIHLDLIDDNPWQPRLAMNLADLADMADDMDQIGMLQAPLGRHKADGRIQLAHGHRRVAACRIRAQRGSAPWQIEMETAVLTDEEMVLIALSENVERQQLTDIEVVRAHKRAVAETSITIQALADKIGVDRATLSNNLRVLDLPDFVLEHVERGDMAMSAAREFLVLQHGDPDDGGHAHIEDMQDIVRAITSVYGRKGMPDWGRRHVRESIYNRVAYNDKDWRPLGPKPAHTTGGANQEANFDVAAFRGEYPDTLHTIPAVSKTEIVNINEMLFCDGSRLWTCNARDWSRWKGRATREANKAAETTGTGGGAATKKNDKASQLGELLAKDPVFKLIAGERETKGPNRPVTAEEQELLGTRATLQEVDGHGGRSFWKRLKVADPDGNPIEWNGYGRLLPPFFSALKDCQSCTAGAAYAKQVGYNSRDNKTFLACFNQACYNEKSNAGADEFRVRLEERKKELFSEDREAAQLLNRQLETLEPGVLHALAAVLVAQSETLGLHHPFGGFVQEWSFEGRAASMAREILGIKLTTGMRGFSMLGDGRMQALENVDRGDVRELVSNLMVQHLRQAGKLDAVSVETAVLPLPPEPPAASSATVAEAPSEAVPVETAAVPLAESKLTRKQMGLCANCNNPPLPDGTRCEECRVKRLKGNVVRTRTLAAVREPETA